jgi:hypothetical protein
MFLVFRNNIYSDINVLAQNAEMELKLTGIYTQSVPSLRLRKIASQLTICSKK